jgi:hypothetical protein
VGILGLLHGGILTVSVLVLLARHFRWSPRDLLQRSGTAGERTMKVLRNLIYREVIQAVLYVSLAFLALFFFFDLVDEMRWVGSGNAGYTATRALLFVALSIPGHLYELMPIAVLIGAIFVMARSPRARSSPSCAPAAWAPGWHCARC